MITDSFEIFSNRYHNKQHIPDDLIKYIMDMNTESIKLEKLKKKLICGDYGLKRFCRRINADRFSPRYYNSSTIEIIFGIKKEEDKFYNDSKCLHNIDPEMHKLMKGYFH